MSAAFRVRPQGSGRGVWGGIAWFLLPLVVLATVIGAVWRERPIDQAPLQSGMSVMFVPSFERLPLPPRGHYEVWVVQPAGGSERLAAFTVSPTGALLSTSGEPYQEFPVGELPPDGSDILVTLEDSLVETPVRSERVLLRGTLAKTEVVFEPAFPQSAAGNHPAFLMAPTDAGAPDTTGVWFARPSGTTGAPGPGVLLPPQPESSGWVYGGFVTTAAGTVLPTGAFLDPRRPDEGAPFSGPRAGLKFPGEDFVRNAPEGVTFPLNLADGRSTVMVALLPDFARDAGKPYVALLSARIPYHQKPGAAFPLSGVSADTFPSGRGVFAQRSP